MKNFLLVLACFLGFPGISLAQVVASPGQHGTVNVSNVDAMMMSPAYLFGNGFEKNISLGTKGVNVKILQRFLNMYGFIIAKTGPGSERNETEHFGSLTKQVLTNFQLAYRQRILSESGSSKLTLGTLDAPTRAFIKKVILTQNSTCDYEKYSATKKFTGMCSINSTFK